MIACISSSATRASVLKVIMRGSPIGRPRAARRASPKGSSSRAARGRKSPAARRRSEGAARIRLTPAGARPCRRRGREAPSYLAMRSLPDRRHPRLDRGGLARDMGGEVVVSLRCDDDVVLDPYADAAVLGGHRLVV